MTPEEWRGLATAHLEQLQDAALEKWAVEQPDTDIYVELLRRYNLAAQAFPGMDWRTFSDLDAKFNRAGKRGRPPRSTEARANHPNWRAANDAGILKALWRALNPDTPRKRPPIHPHQIAADHHGIDRQSVDDAVNRPSSRRLDRLAAQKT